MYESKLAFWGEFANIDYKPEISMHGLTKMPKIADGRELVPFYFLADYELDHRFGPDAGDWMPWVRSAAKCWYVNVNPASDKHNLILAASLPLEDCAEVEMIY